MKIGGKNVSIVKPFKGVKYNLEKVLLKHVIAPPYDVISPEMREGFILRSPYNVVQIDLPIGGDDKYDVAGNLYRQWLSDNILVKDERPAFYLYEQVYEYDGRQYVRSGFVGTLKLSEFGKGQVFPHERTLSGPKKDRYELMKASKANFSQVFGLYQDQENMLNSLFNEIKKTMPAVSAVDDEKVKHSIWVIDKPENIEYIQNFMQDKSIYIADGHHRYETALKYRDDMRAANNDSSDDVKPYDFVMMMFINFQDKGLKVFPTHRVIDVDSDFNDATVINGLKSMFDCVPLSGKEEVETFLNDTADLTGAWVFMGMQGIYGMKIIKESMECLHPVYRKVDTYLLEDLVLKTQLGFTDEKLLAKEGIHFIQTLDEIAKYREKMPSVAFILHPEDMETIRDVSESNLVMPQKSTFFYPKLATGLLFNDL